MRRKPHPPTPDAVVTMTFAPSGPTAEPRRGDYPTHDAYLLAWHTWRAVERDSRLSPEEYAVRGAAVEELARAKLEARR